MFTNHYYNDLRIMIYIGYLWIMYWLFRLFYNDRLLNGVTDEERKPLVVRAMCS